MMLIGKSRRNLYSGRGRSGIRSTIVLLTIAGMGYIAGAVIHGSLPPSNEPVALARSASAAETNSGNGLPAAVPLPTLRGAHESRGLDADGVENPRECDLLKGVSTACLFMD